MREGRTANVIEDVALDVVGLSPIDWWNDAGGKGVVDIDVTKRSASGRAVSYCETLEPWRDDVIDLEECTPGSALAPH